MTADGSEGRKLPPYRPPWKWMGAVAGAGALALLLGALLGQVWLLVIGAGAQALWPAGLLLPARAVTRASTGPNHYSDANFVGGMLTVLGIKPTEQEAAGREKQRPNVQEPE